MLKNVINGNSGKNTRRHFLILLGLFSLLTIPSFSKSKKKELIDKNELFIVDGWVLKKGDIYDL